MILSLDVFVREPCIFCTNLKVVLNRLVEKKFINFKINYKLAKNNESVPYTIKYSDNKEPQTIYGFPEKSKLFRFLELKDESISIFQETERKNRKIFSIS